MDLFTSIFILAQKLMEWLCCTIWRIEISAALHPANKSNWSKWLLLGRTHEKQWIRRSESTSAKREWIWIYESTAFECVLRLNTPQTNRHFYDWVSCSWYILDEIVFNNYICIIIYVYSQAILHTNYMYTSIYREHGQICHIISIHL